MYHLTFDHDQRAMRQLFVYARLRMSNCCTLTKFDACESAHHLCSGRLRFSKIFFPIQPWQPRQLRSRPLTDLHTKWPRDSCWLCDDGSGCCENSIWRDDNQIVHFTPMPFGSLLSIASRKTSSANELSQLWFTALINDVICHSGLVRTCMGAMLS